MKKSNKLALIVILVMAVSLLLVACAPKDENGLVKLDAPTDISLNGDAVSWSSVAGATKYYVKVGETEYETKSTNFVIKVDEIGIYPVVVRAYGDGKKYGTSDWSTTVEYVKGQQLSSPTVTIDNNSKLATWQAVDKAAEYVVKVEAKLNPKEDKLSVVDELTTTELSYSFDKEDKYVKPNAYQITVIAKPSADERVFVQSKASEVKKYIVSKVLDTPKWDKVTTSSIWWNAVDEVATHNLRYELKVTHNGKSETYTTSATSFSITKLNLPEAGDYTLNIRTLGDGEVYLSSEYSQDNSDFVLTKLSPVDNANIKFTPSTKYGEKNELTFTLTNAKDVQKVRIILETYVASGDRKLSQVTKDITMVEGQTTYETILDDLFFEEVEGTTELNPTKSDEEYYGKNYAISVLCISDQAKIIDSDIAKTEYVYSNYKKPTKSEAGVYLIHNVGELAYMRIEPNATYQLENDIAFNGYEFETIPNFKGRLYGNNKAIKDMVLTAKDGNIGLVGTLAGDDSSKGEIVNLVLRNVRTKINGKIENAGAIAAINQGIISNCYVTGTIKTALYEKDIEDKDKTAPRYVGGLVGDNQGSIKGSYANVEVEGQIAGGLVAKNSGNIVGGYALGVVNAKAYDKDYEEGANKAITCDIWAGGLVAYNEGTVNNVFAVNNVKAEGRTGDKIYSGGFVAVNKQVGEDKLTGVIYNCYAGDMYSKDATKRLNVVASGNASIAGGFVGENSGQILNCYATSRASGSGMSAGFVGENSGEIKNSFCTGGTENSGVRGGFASTNTGAVTNCYYYAISFNARADEAGTKIDESGLATLDTKLSDGETPSAFGKFTNGLAPVLKNMIYVEKYSVDVKESIWLSQEGRIVNNAGETIYLGYGHKVDDKDTFEMLGENIKGRVVQGQYIYGDKTLQIVVNIK